MTAPVTYVPGWVTFPDFVLRRLWCDLSWERRPGLPRREYYCNTVPSPYTYGTPPYDRTYYPKVWHPEIVSLRDRLEEETRSAFEACFLNGYEDQSDNLGWHSDDSPEMDGGRPIAIVSLGAEREIWFRPKPHRDESGKAATGPVEKLVLGHGSLCVMAPGMQSTHQHRIPKAGFECGVRVSLTFRGYLGEKE